MATVAEGEAAPAFTLPASDGTKVSLKDFKGKQQVVLYFYPKDNTPGCTREACSFRDQATRLKKKGAVVLGISRDSLASHDKFIQKFKLPFLLLSDEDGAVCEEYDVIREKNLYGKMVKGIERSTFLIDRDGKVRKMFRKVKVDGHIDEVLAALD
ncbi:MAG: thioredoxin-dependent thiol peroxidase [Phycisphaerae bacterium]|nr:thioredoxin-dependent thiol peroxidase [Phycisphaerae bacterium]